MGSSFSLAVKHRPPCQHHRSLGFKKGGKKTFRKKREEGKSALLLGVQRSGREKITVLRSLSAALKYETNACRSLKGSSKGRAKSSCRRTSRGKKRKRALAQHRLAREKAYLLVPRGKIQRALSQKQSGKEELDGEWLFK